MALLTKNGTGKTDAILQKKVVSSGKELLAQSMLLDQGSYMRREAHLTVQFLQTIATEPQFADG